MPHGASAIMATMSAPASSLTPSRTLPLPRLALFGLAAGVIGLWLYATPGGLLGKADAIGYAVCHRIDLRSFHLGERALPLCSRCTGMYLGSLLGFGFLAWRGRGRAGSHPPMRILAVLGVFALAFAVDGVNSFLHFFPHAPHLYPPDNTLRLITGTLLGLGLPVMVLPGFNQTAWRDWRPEPVLRTLGELGLLLTAAAGVVLLVLSGNPLILYPMALISSLGVVVLLTTVYTMLVLILFHREGQFTSGWQLGLPLLGGLTLAMAQIALLDLARYWLTGTWAGFKL